MVVIKDPIHGNIDLSEMELSLIDTPHMQRLRSIKQLAMAYLVYPGANHTRFEHSMGTMALTGNICGHFGFDKEKREKLRAAALLHDVGHLAFSHESESVTAHIFGDHEKLGRQILLRSEIADILNEKYSGKEVADMLHNRELGQLIVSDIGSDRMDYLIRDSRYTGVAYGIIDVERIIQTLGMNRGRVVIQENGLESAESLLVARFMMFSTVYLHHTVRIASKMLQRSLENALAAGKVTEEHLLALGDSEILSLMLECKESSALAKGIRYRQLYKEAYSAELGKLTPEVRKMAKNGDLESMISEKAGTQVFVDLPTYFAKRAKVMVLKESGLVPIEEFSNLVRALELSEKQRIRLMVCCKPEKRRHVAATCEKVIGKLLRK